MTAQGNTNTTTPAISRMTVTPDWAKSTLRNTPKGQRSLRRAHVSLIARDIISGKWDSDICNPIRVSTTGQLIDGQHRLAAVVEAGVPVRMWIERRDSFLHIDSCKSRSNADVLTMGGVTSASKTASVIRVWTCAKRALIEDGDFSNVLKKNQMTASELLNIATSDNRVLPIVQAAESVYKMAPKSGSVFTVSSVGAFLMLASDLFGSYDQHLAWVRSVATDIGHEAASPALAYRRWALRASGVDRARYELPNIIRCWNMNARGKTMVQAPGFRLTKIEQIEAPPQDQYA